MISSPSAWAPVCQARARAWARAARKPAGRARRRQHALPPARRSRWKPRSRTARAGCAGRPGRSSSRRHRPAAPQGRAAPGRPGGAAGLPPALTQTRRPAPRRPLRPACLPARRQRGRLLHQRAAVLVDDRTRRRAATAQFLAERKLTAAPPDFNAKTCSSSTSSVACGHRPAAMETGTPTTRSGGRDSPAQSAAPKKRLRPPSGQPPRPFLSAWNGSGPHLRRSPTLSGRSHHTEGAGRSMLTRRSPGCPPGGERLASSSWRWRRPTAARRLGHVRR
jgi:hypothetical protein